jgi:hypothetical protein
MSSNTRLYYPIEKIRNTFSKVSLNTFYKVAFPLSNRSAGNAGLVSWLKTAGIYDVAESNGLDPIEAIELLCSGTVLPGPNFKTTDTISNRQGIVEKYPILRQYPELTMTFYVDNNHRIIRFFEEWINFINPLYSGEGIVTSSEQGQQYPIAGNENNFMKFRYPNEYCQRILVTKFEKDLGTVTRKNSTTVTSFNSSYLTYEFIQAYPSNIIVSPVTYQTSEILTFTVNFNYSRYIIRRNLGATKEYESKITLPDVQTRDTLEGFGYTFNDAKWQGLLRGPEYYNNFGDTKQDATNTPNFFGAA